MWRNLIFLHMGSIFKYCHMKDVDKSKISPHLAYVWWGEWLHMCEIHAFWLQNWFWVLLQFTHFCCRFLLSQFTLFCVEKKLTNNCVVGEKMTNIRYGCHIFYIYTTLQCYKVKYAATLQQVPILSRFLKSAEWIRYIPIYWDLPSNCDIWPAD